MTDKKELQQKYLELQLIVQQVQQLQQQLEQIQHQSEEFNQLALNLDDIKDIKEGTETLVPLGAGIFLKTKLDKTSKLLINVGSNIVVERSLQEAKELVNKNIKEMDKIIEDMEGKLQNAVLYAQILQAELQRQSGQQ